MSMEDIIEELYERREKAKKMGGAERIAKQHKRGRLTARERVDRPEEPPADGSIRQWARKALTNEPGMKKFVNLIDHVASALICEALDIAGGNRTRAANILGVSRPTLQSKIGKYGITMEPLGKSE